MRVGVIGTGFGARVVAPAFAAVPGCEVVDVASPRDPAAVGELCKRRDVDLISVHSPPFLHEANVLAAVDGGHHVLCDKPLGRSAEEAERMLDAATAAGVLHFANFEFRREPARLAMRRLLLDRDFGTLEHLHWTHLRSSSRHPTRKHGWLFERDKGGGWLGAWGSHAIDAIRFLTGADVTTATGSLRTTVGRRLAADGTARAVDVEDGFTALLTLSGGATAVIDSSFAAPVDMTPRLTLFGSGYTLDCAGDRRLAIRHPDGTSIKVPLPAPAGDVHAGPMAAWAAAVHGAVQRGEQIAPSLADGVATARVLDQLRSGGRW